MLAFQWVTHSTHIRASSRVLNASLLRCKRAAWGGRVPPSPPLAARRCARCTTWCSATSGASRRRRWDHCKPYKTCKHADWGRAGCPFATFGGPPMRALHDLVQRSQRRFSAPCILLQYEYASWGGQGAPSPTSAARTCARCTTWCSATSGASGAAAGAAGRAAERGRHALGRRDRGRAEEAHPGVLDRGQPRGPAPAHGARRCIPLAHLKPRHCSRNAAAVRARVTSASAPQVPQVLLQLNPPQKNPLLDTLKRFTTMRAAWSCAARSITLQATLVLRIMLRARIHSAGMTGNTTVLFPCCLLARSQMTHLLGRTWRGRRACTACRSSPSPSAPRPTT